MTILKLLDGNSIFEHSVHIQNPKLGIITYIVEFVKSYFDILIIIQ